MRPARLREAHAHVGQLGESLAMVDLSDATSVGDVLVRIEDRAAAHPADGANDWVVGRSLRIEGFDEPRWPGADELDRAAGGRPCAVISFDHHALAAGRTALRLAGIEAAPADPPDPYVERDRAGRPTGVLLERAARQVWSLFSARTHEQRRADTLAGMTRLAEMGFAEIHDLLTHLPLLDALFDLDDELERLDVVVRAYVPFDQLIDHQSRPLASRSGRVRVAGAKIFVDGTLNCRTAWMLEPFLEPMPGHPTGMALIEPGELRNIVSTCDDLGLPVAAHAIGDGAVRAVLDSIESVAPTTRGFRIEHAELIDEADVPRFADLGVICSPQPCHLLADVEALNRYLPHRLDRVLPLRELIDAGCAPGELLWFGSDVPIVRADPEDSIQAATQRRRVGMDPARAIAPAQAITEAEAWACFAPAEGG
jgi:predicted amidohydrolase YtcJ